MPVKKTAPLPADLAFLRSARAVLSRKFPAKEGYALFLRAAHTRSLGKELYAGRTLSKREEVLGAHADVVDRKGRLATLRVGSGNVAAVKAACAHFDPAAFVAVPGSYSVKPVAKGNFPRKGALPARAVETEYRALLAACKKRLTTEGARRGVAFKLENLGVTVDSSSESYWSSAGGECRQDLSPRFSVGGEIMAQWKGKKDDGYFSFTSARVDRDGALREIDEALDEAAQAVRKPRGAYERVRGNVRIDAKLFMELLGELEDHLSVRWAKEGMSLALGKDMAQKADFSPLLSVDLVAQDGTAFDRLLTDKGKPVEDKALLKYGKVAHPLAGEDDLDKYRWPAKKACVGQPVTRVVPGPGDITDAQTDFFLLRLNALHNLNAQTLEMNLTGSGFVLEKGKRRFSSNLVLKCNLLDIFRGLEKVGKTVRRQHDWSCPDVLVRLA